MKNPVTLVLLTAFLALGAASIPVEQAEARHATRHSSVGAAKKHASARKSRSTRHKIGRKSKKSHRVTKEKSISVLREYLPAYADLHETKNPDPARVQIPLPANFDYRSPFASNALRIDLIRNIDSWLGTRYRYGGHSSRGIDCSGFTSAVVSNTLNSSFHGNSRWQAQQLLPVFDTDSLQFGDLLFFTGRGRRSAHIGHVGIYLGNGVFAHSSTGRGVMYSHITEGYYTSRFRYGGRFVANAASVGRHTQYAHQ